MRSFIGIGCALLIATAAASKEYVVNVYVDGKQGSQFIQGREAVIDRLPSSNALILEALDPFAKRAVMVVGVANFGGEPFNFGPENVTVTIADQTVAMITYDDLMREQKRREGRERFAMALAGAMNSASASYAGNSYGTTTYSGSTTGNVNGQPFAARIFGTGTYNGYDASAAQVARLRADAKTESDSAELEAKLAARRADVERVVQLNTILPGQTFNGLVQFDVPATVASRKAPVPVLISVRAGQDLHIFHAMLGTSKMFRGKK